MIDLGLDLPPEGTIVIFGFILAGIIFVGLTIILVIKEFLKRRSGK